MIRLKGAVLYNNNAPNLGALRRKLLILSMNRFDTAGANAPSKNKVLPKIDANPLILLGLPLKTLFPSKTVDFIYFSAAKYIRLKPGYPHQLSDFWPDYRLHRPRHHHAVR